MVEYAAVVWDAGLTIDNINQMERVQKSVFCVILGNKYTMYEEACSHLNIKTLAERQNKLSLKFAKKASVHPIHKTWFVQNHESTTRQEKNMHVEGLRDF